MAERVQSMTVVHAVLAELVAPDHPWATVVHWWNALDGRERERVLERCAAAVDRVMPRG